MLIALALESWMEGMSGFMWKDSLSLFQAAVYFLCQRQTQNMKSIFYLIKRSMSASSSNYLVHKLQLIDFGDIVGNQKM